MKAVITSVNYDDYLTISLPYIKKHFKDITIITDNKDTATHNLCQSHNLVPFITDSFYINNAPFNRGRAINDFLKTVAPETWVCFLDADIILPDNFSNELNKINLQKNTIYGCNRLMCPSKEEWENYLRIKKTSTWHEYKPKNFIIKVSNKKAKNPRFREQMIKIEDFIPVGYMQLFNMSAPALKKKPIYPETSRDVSKADIHFAFKWENKFCIDKIKLIHLPVIGIPGDGVNWSGRKSQRFI